MWTAKGILVRAFLCMCVHTVYTDALHVCAVMQTHVPPPTCVERDYFSRERGGHSVRDWGLFRRIPAQNENSAEIKKQK